MPAEGREEKGQKSNDRSNSSGDSDSNWRSKQDSESAKRIERVHPYRSLDRNNRRFGDDRRYYDDENDRRRFYDDDDRRRYYDDDDGNRYYDDDDRRRYLMMVIVAEIMMMMIAADTMMMMISRRYYDDDDRRRYYDDDDRRRYYDDDDDRRYYDDRQYNDDRRYSDDRRVDHRNKRAPGRRSDSNFPVNRSKSAAFKKGKVEYGFVKVLNTNYGFIDRIKHQSDLFFP